MIGTCGREGGRGRRGLVLNCDRFSENASLSAVWLFVTVNQSLSRISRRDYIYKMKRMNLVILSTSHLSTGLKITRILCICNNEREIGAKMVFKFNVPAVRPRYPSFTSSCQFQMICFIKSFIFHPMCTVNGKRSAKLNCGFAPVTRDIRQLYRDIVTRNEGCHSRTYGCRKKKGGQSFAGSSRKKERERIQRFYVLLHSSLPPSRPPPTPPVKRERLLLRAR